MIELAKANLPLLIALFVIGIGVAWWVFAWRARPLVSKTVRDIPKTPEPQTAEPAPEPEPVTVPEADGPPDNLQTLKGVGPKLAAMLGERGITRFDQLAALSAGQLAALDAGLGNFSGRLARDRVAEQAALLAAGDTDGFQARFGNLGGA